MLTSKLNNLGENTTFVCIVPKSYFQTKTENYHFIFIVAVINSKEYFIYCNFLFLFIVPYDLQNTYLSP